ncbi:hypothetical protein BS78_03G212700 [Paspalum vaginatum]|nr:hypothetical protein BS78_03G212700 [Paspalum vaginatum]
MYSAARFWSFVVVCQFDGSVSHVGRKLMTVPTFDFNSNRQLLPQTGEPEFEGLGKVLVNLNLKDWKGS